MIYDVWYWVVIGAGMLLSFGASALVKSTFAKYSQFTTRSGMTGADVARRILADNGIHDVRVERVPGHLSDHYDPTNKVLRLSEAVYDQRNMAAFGVAAHEVGHAIQHATGYAPLKFRSAWVPLANIGSNLGIWVVFLSLVMGAARGAGLPFIIGLVGLGLFACATVFTLITLPVEFDASKRAIVALENGGYTTTEEVEGARKVLNAAAMTYVAAAAASILQLLYWASLLLGNRDD
ncbi:MAG: zinc metallopeptidase [Planctomycetes bacterium]|nr:zinc metallopeptidase [Planctomycetota bacterium]MCB9917534.1 zinc metallopeptidase [Planctomycetota bacterium]